jgi:hypothetical protein
LFCSSTATIGTRRRRRQNCCARAVPGRLRLPTHRQALAIRCSTDILRHAHNPLLEGSTQFCPVRCMFDTFQAVHLKFQIIQCKLPHDSSFDNVHYLKTRNPCGPIPSTRSLECFLSPPTAFDEDPMVPSVAPSRGDPYSVLAWRCFPPSRHPHVSTSVPPVITADPYVMRPWSGGSMLHHGPWRRNIHHNFRCSRRSDSDAYSQESCQKSLSHLRLL